MKKELSTIKKLIEMKKDKIIDEYKIKSIGIFGSYARGEQNDKSDIDIVVEFSSPVGIEFVHLKEYLSELHI